VVQAPGSGSLLLLPSSCWPDRAPAANFGSGRPCPQDLLLALSNFPAPSASPVRASGAAPPPPGAPGEGADFLIGRIVDTISKEVRSEEGLLKYLRMVMALKASPYFASIPTATRVRLQVCCEGTGEAGSGKFLLCQGVQPAGCVVLLLAHGVHRGACSTFESQPVSVQQLLCQTQPTPPLAYPKHNPCSPALLPHPPQGEIYSLTQSGGPRYAPRSVNKLAFAALDTLFPLGKRTRRLINVGFKFLHPQDWPWFLWDMLLLAARAAWLWLAAVWGAVAAAGRRVRVPRIRRQ
jgi:hypothetical protein